MLSFSSVSSCIVNLDDSVCSNGLPETFLVGLRPHFLDPLCFFPAGLDETLDGSYECGFHSVFSPAAVVWPGG